MGQSDLEAQPELSRVIFPRPVGANELKDIIRYFVSQVDETSRESNASAVLTLEESTNYGYYLEKRSYDNPYDVPVRFTGLNGSGNIKKGHASIYFRIFSDTLHRDFQIPVAAGFNFDVGDEVRAEVFELISNFRGYIGRYFEKTGKPARAF